MLYHLRHTQDAVRGGTYSRGHLFSFWTFRGVLIRERALIQINTVVTLKRTKSSVTCLPGNIVLHLSSGGSEKVVGFFPVLSLTSAENGDSFFPFSSFLSSTTSTFFSVIASLSPGFSSATKFYKKKTQFVMSINLILHLHRYSV